MNWPSNCSFGLRKVRRVGDVGRHRDVVDDEHERGQRLAAVGDGDVPFGPSKAADERRGREVAVRLRRPRHLRRS